MMSNGIKRRILLMHSVGGTSFVLPTFTGNHSIFGDETQGYIECYSSGDLTFSGKGVVDIFLLGGGKAGAKASTSGAFAGGGTGGAGSAGQSAFGVEVDGAYSVQVGSSGGTSTAFGYSGVSGGGASGGRGANTSTASAAGGTGTSYPFGETSGIFYKQYGAGGGGGGYRSMVETTGIPTGNVISDNYKQSKSGGVLGGGTGGSYSGGNGTAGAANTGSGGGGGGYYYHTYYDEGTGYYVDASTRAGTGGAGGSGIVIVRWGY